MCVCVRVRVCVCARILVGTLEWLLSNRSFDKQISCHKKGGGVMGWIGSTQRRYDNRAPGSTVEVLPRP